MSTYKFIWLDGRVSKGRGNTPREAYDTLLSRKSVKKLLKVEKVEE